MPPRQRHQWTEAEKDALIMMWTEYNLTANEIWRIFVLVFSPFSPPERNVTDYYRSRNTASGTRGKWAAHHDQPVDQITTQQQQTRAAVRGHIVAAAAQGNIALNLRDPNNATLQGLHNTAAATPPTSIAYDYNAPLPTPANPPPKRGTEGGGDKQPKQPKTAGKADVSGGTAPTQPPATGGTLGLLPSNDLTSGLLGSDDNVPEIGTPENWDAENEADLVAYNTLSMVHWSNLDMNKDSNGDYYNSAPRYRTEHQSLFKGSSPMWARGGPVINVFVQADDQRPSGTWNVMVCETANCQTCNPQASAQDAAKIQKRYGGFPFVHATECIPNDLPGARTFAPGWNNDSHGWTSALKGLIEFSEGSLESFFVAAVCVQSTCTVCTPPPLAAKPFLYMVHHSDLKSNLDDDTNQVIDGTPRHKIAERCLSGRDNLDPMSRAEGRAVNVRLYETVGTPSVYSHVKLCDYDFCRLCGVAENKPWTTRLLPYAGSILAHSGQCSRTASRIIYNPRWKMDVLRPPPTSLVQNMVTFFHKGTLTMLQTRVCDPQSICPECRADPPREDVLPIVHRRFLSSPNTLQRSGDPSQDEPWTCQQDSDLHDETDEEWHRGGPALRIWVPGGDTVPEYDADSLIPPTADELALRGRGKIRNVMVCQFGSCQSCGGSGTGYKPYRMPFCHNRALQVYPFGDGIPTFMPPAQYPRDNAVVCEVTEAPIHFEETRTLADTSPPVITAVCRPGTCSVCPSSDPVIPLKGTTGSSGDGAGGVDPLGLSGFIFYGIGGDDMSLDDPQPESAPSTGPGDGNGLSGGSPSGGGDSDGLGGSTTTGGPASTPSDGTLMMVHWNDLAPNEGWQPRNEPAWTTHQDNMFDSQGEDYAMYARGGPTLNCLITDDSGSRSEWHLMACDRIQCTKCLGDQAMPGFALLGGRPFVHIGDLEMLRFFNPADGSDTWRRTNIADMDLTTTRRVTFIVADSQLITTAVVCSSTGLACSVCRPRRSDGNSGGTQITSTSATRKLKMVHYDHVFDRWPAGIPVAPGVSRYRVDRNTLFDDTSTDPEERTLWRHGGPVLNIFVPGNDTQPDTNYHLMLCDVRECSQCPSHVDGTVSSYGGQAFVHSSQCVTTTSGLTFAPSALTRRNRAHIFGGPTTSQLVNYFEGSRSIAQMSTVCTRDNCLFCSPDDFNAMAMVHRAAMVPVIPTTFGNTFQVRYQCQPSDLLYRTAAEWHRGGPVMKVLVRDVVGSQVWDVMTCQYQACSACLQASLPTRSYTNHRAPFVHGKACQQVDGAPARVFVPLPGLRKDEGIDCRVEAEMISYSQGGPAANNLRPVPSSVCVQDSCPVCSVPDPEDGLATTVTNRPTIPTEPTVPAPRRRPNTRSTARGNGGDPPAPPPARPEPSRSTRAKGSARDTSKAPQATLPPTAPSSNRLRMCHRAHVQIDPNGNASWLQKLRDDHRGDVEDSYFVVTDPSRPNSDVYRCGGPVHRVNFPDGTTLDVMICVRTQCRLCNKKGNAAILANTHTNGEPFLHRREITNTVFGPTFTPRNPHAYRAPQARWGMQSRNVHFPRGASTGNIMTQCHVCTAGNCNVCA